MTRWRTSAGGHLTEFDFMRYHIAQRYAGGWPRAGLLSYLLNNYARIPRAWHQALDLPP